MSRYTKHYKGANAVLQGFTDSMYWALFDATGDELRARLGLSKHDTLHDDNLRDHMGEEALEAITMVEGYTAAEIAKATDANKYEILRQCLQYAVEVGKLFNAVSADRQIDFLTGKPLSQRVD